ncbi:MAG TPA: hypothetical protein VFG43_01500 [Geminicoccaceae bacterium]|nr:hypothetical protein [Geminicoccaceae bacterium]
MSDITLESLARQQERILAALDAATGGGALTLSSLAAQQERFAAQQERFAAQQELLSKQQERLSAEVGQVRDDLRAMGAVVQRLDTTVDAATGGGRLTLAFLGKQQERLVEEMGQVRDDLRVMGALVQRLDGTVQGLVNEVRASHARWDRLARRVERLEAGQPS